MVHSSYLFSDFLLYALYNRRARREGRRDKSAVTFAINDNVPALQELLNTPLTTFPPLEAELWTRGHSSSGDTVALAGDGSNGAVKGVPGHSRTSSKQLR